MKVSTRALIELVLLGPSNDRRQLQDTPILGDVWIAFAVKPAEPLDLLITPHKDQPAGSLAVAISKRIKNLSITNSDAHVAYLQGLVAAKLSFEEMLRVIVPMTPWWREQKPAQSLKAYTEGTRLTDNLKTVIAWANARTQDEQMQRSSAFADFSPLDRYVTLAGIILWSAKNTQDTSSDFDSGDTSIGAALTRFTLEEEVESIRGALTPIYQDLQVEPPRDGPRIFQVSLNRRAMPAMDKSVPAVKGDAARTLFRVSCDKINWAILDSGIDGTHEAFKGKNGKSRIKKAYDFSKIREIVSLENLDTDTQAFKDRVAELRAGKEDKLDEITATENLAQLARNAENDRPIHWELVEAFIDIDPKTKPKSGHGTHVAGIVGANGEMCKTGAVDAEEDEEDQLPDGMCPDINFYDFRVLSKTVQDTEFAIIAALQFLLYLNNRQAYITIHGANLSLSIPHDVRNFACGRTPICNEAERLVENGVVVVAAAGNLGYQRFETQEGSYEGYTAFSVTDPGNADGVITVGATHRYRPHTYGVSFFSSRGPTGDGRLKPDLVAPGERIQSCLPDNSWGELDGTSMAAPHVSGAAAMLMARYTELIGSPRRIKQILCESATDLGRERSFQGNGMLDVLRAFQRI